MTKPREKGEMIQGALDMLILKTLTRGAMHGYAIARGIQESSDGFLTVEEGSLYPALHRMERREWLVSEWGLSESNRRAKYYSLTAAGRAQLKRASKNWTLLVRAIAGVMEPGTSGAS